MRVVACVQRRQVIDKRYLAHAFWRAPTQFYHHVPDKRLDVHAIEQLIKQLALMLAQAFLDRLQIRSCVGSTSVDDVRGSH